MLEPESAKTQLATWVKVRGSGAEMAVAPRDEDGGIDIGDGNLKVGGSWGTIDMTA